MLLCAVILAAALCAGLAGVPGLVALLIFALLLSSLSRRAPQRPRFVPDDTVLFVITIRHASEQGRAA